MTMWLLLQSPEWCITTDQRRTGKVREVLRTLFSRRFNQPFTREPEKTRTVHLNAKWLARQGSGINCRRGTRVSWTQSGTQATQRAAAGSWLEQKQNSKAWPAPVSNKGLPLMRLHCAAATLLPTRCKHGDHCLRLARLALPRARLVQRAARL